MKISATIITFNEEHNIQKLLDSLDFFDDIVIVDSFSTDRTEALAKRSNVRFFSKEFLGYGEQKNYAASLANHDWIFSIDADEVVSPNLKEQIQSLSLESQNVVYEVNRKNFFMGQFIRHGGWYPDRIVRLYNKAFTKFDNPEVHEKIVTPPNTVIKALDGDLCHFTFNSIEQQIRTNLKYALQGARLLNKKNKKPPSLFKIVFKPWLKFIECYFLKLGFMDGKYGYIIARNAAYSIFMKYVFARFELQGKDQ